MIERTFWLSRIQTAWKKAPLVWLSGVRRTGKTTLAQSLGKDRTEIINCDNPSVEDMVKDPFLFFKNIEKPIVVFDEIHQLKDPSRLLKIGTDEFPNKKLLATGSSTLAASEKFKDTLTGRKQTVHLVPVLIDELPNFHIASLQKRLFQGGLPQMLLDSHKDSSKFREWLDSFFARDIQRLFSFRDINRFNTLLEFILKQSGGIVEIAATSRNLGISRPTVESHFRALEITHAATFVRPYHGGGQKEIIKQPKVYGFDTGFVSYTRGWDPLRPSDLGILWEHLVLEFLQAHIPDNPIFYWRDIDGREIDFVVPRSRESVDTIECKWSPNDFDPKALLTFRSYYPKGSNFILSPEVANPYNKIFKKQTVRICSPAAYLKTI
ncbi:MAG: hypothetical protein KCHDKBKB_02326 [Elusimicrobia bacterium]|nr:hypothetical protein [Elusimicrobiota bacterium]